MTLETLTTISTTCIVISGLSVLSGWYFIRWRRNMIWHRNAMIAATSFAALFLVSYVTRWSLYGSKPFEGEGWWRVLYLANLIPHILMALVVGPLAVQLLNLALRKKDFARHKKLARITLPIWLYVAASGWLIYFMLYRMEF